MESLLLEQSKSTPFIRFDAVTGVCEIAGECYPENAGKFFGPVLEWLKQYLTSESTHELQLNVHMNYFNSSSSKAFMNLFELLEEFASAGRQVCVNWKFDSENEPILEAGEEFREELSSVSFNLVAVSEG
ncbi:MAG: DUF1987 domain-containing protein [Thermodesulfobacteriota bacterium]